jgi:hypothetical protein
MFAFIRQAGRHLDPTLCGFVLIIVAAAPGPSAFGDSLGTFAESLFNAFWTAMENSNVHAHVALLYAHLVDSLLLLLSRYTLLTREVILGSLLPKLLTHPMCIKVRIHVSVSLIEVCSF